MVAKASNIKLNIYAKAAQQAAYGKLDISVKTQGDLARVRIIGEIYSGWTDSDFRFDMQAAITNGARNVEVYLNTVGGDVFAASEIVNIINEFKENTRGTVTGRGGALVASAGTFIAVHCDSFSQASNGSFMVHKPWGWIQGTADKLEGYVKLLRNLEEQYADAYANKTGRTADDIKELYAKADYWMTAREAKEQGFIDAIAGEEIITEETAAMFAACGRPAPQGYKAKQNQKDNNKSNMELKLVAVALGLNPDATEVEVNTEIKRLRASEVELQTMRVAKTNSEITARAARIKSTLDEAVKAMRIAPSHRTYFETELAIASKEGETALEAKIAEINARPAMPNLNAAIEPKAVDFTDSKVPKDRREWDFDKWNTEDPKGLQALAKQDEQAYLKLYNEKHNTTLTAL